MELPKFNVVFVGLIKFGAGVFPPILEDAAVLFKDALDFAASALFHIAWDFF